MEDNEQELITIKDFMLTKTKMNMILSKKYIDPIEQLKILDFIDILNDYYFSKRHDEDFFLKIPNCFYIENYIEDMNNEIQTNKYGFKEDFVDFINMNCSDYNKNIDKNDNTSLNNYFNDYINFVKN
jgi:hypothetical protein